MRFTNETDAVTYIFTSLANSNWRGRGLDEETRDLEPSRRLLDIHGLLRARREYAVVTGSKGKGSVTMLTAAILRELGHTVGTITSPHLIGYRERMRINGRAIPEADFLRLVDSFAPSIDAIVGDLSDGKYLSPQGIFLALALRWFDENDCQVAVIEVGRGGRFDENSLVPNRLALFSPIVLEHTRYLGPTVERIAWHKAGILKPNGRGLSLPQSPAVVNELRAEALRVGADLRFLQPTDLGRFVSDWERGVTMELPDGSQIDLPFYGRYEIENATLALHAAYELSSAQDGPRPDYGNRAVRALEAARWPGRCEKLADDPAIFIDGAINRLSLRLFFESLENRLTRPLVVVAAVPLDRDIPTTYRMMAEQADHLILSASPRNITIHFPGPDEAIASAKAALAEIGREIPVEYAATIREAIPRAQAAAGPDGTVLMAVAQPAIGDAMEYFGRSFEQL
jgi:dihydrofolate synthase / folylpolyglutamate synthase